MSPHSTMWAIGVHDIGKAMTNVSASSPQPDSSTTIPSQSFIDLFLRFLRFGLLAWGGPIAQISMLRQSLVDEEHWVSSAHFNRVVALYQALPGPEAHELCVYFGMLARGRLGGLIAGLAFMLPGFVLMFGLSWTYLRYGMEMQGNLAMLFAAVQTAVVALIVRAVHRIGSHVLLDGWLWIIGIFAFFGQLLGVHFGILLFAGGSIYFLAQRHSAAAKGLLAGCAFALALWFANRGGVIVDMAMPAAHVDNVSLLALFWLGLKAGALTFGGAYTAIPLVQRDAVLHGGWITGAQFMDGIALSGLLPAPLIIFTTFVGYVAGGPLGSIVMTIATFFPAFAITLFAHESLERLIHDPRIRAFLDGLTAAVVGLIAATAATLLIAVVNNLQNAGIFLSALLALFYFKKKWAIPLVIGAAAVTGYLALRFGG